MRRVVVGLGAAVMMAGSAFGAAPAVAATPEECVETFVKPPEQDVVAVDGLDVTISPGSVAGMLTYDYVWSIANHWVVFAFCVENGAVSPVAICRFNQALAIATSVDPVSLDLRYVTRNPDGTVTIHGSRVVADLGSCA